MINTKKDENTAKLSNIPAEIRIENKQKIPTDNVTAQ
jgi:hypothetical protein